MDNNKIYISGTLDKEGKQGLVSVPLERINFFSTEGKRIIFGTSDCIYYLPDTIAGINVALQATKHESGQFEKFDRSCIVKIEEVDEVDGVWSRIYFKPSSMGKSLFRDVSKGAFRLIREKLTKKKP
ncbi:LytTR family transcriptional regulator DNA-binding domain-containing protein [Paenibacillus sp. y28]|uniref:LytTR family transcriptional regulator DNA-binding domain-containing protein n=1 Tax=Paenibacillus sp. y28 TaxID=3129110 RepID=UPI0030186559